MEQQRVYLGILLQKLLKSFGDGFKILPILLHDYILSDRLLYFSISEYADDFLISSLLKI